MLEVELPAERVQRAVAEAVRHLGRRTRVPGFRPGKVPRPMLERALGVRRDDPDAPNQLFEHAKEHLFEATVIDAIREQELDPLSIPAPEWTSFDEQAGAVYRVTLPIRPEVTLGAYTDYPFSIEVNEPDDARIDAVIDELRDQHAALVPVEDRAAENGDYLVIKFEGRRDGEPIEGASADRLPLVLGSERLIPGFEEQLLGLRENESKTFPIRFPDDYGEESLAGVEAEFDATILELRTKRLPEADDDFARTVGDYTALSELREEIRGRLERNAKDQARHTFADRIIEFALENATVEVPELMIERETDVMLDELKVRLSNQGIGYEEYLKATEKDEAALREEYREPAEKRVKTMLVIAAISDKEEITVPDEVIEHQIELQRQREGANAKYLAYLESERGRSFLRSELRRSRTVETLIDRYIEEHPEFSDVQHLEDQPDEIETEAEAEAPAEADEPAPAPVAAASEE